MPITFSSGAIYYPPEEVDGVNSLYIPINDIDAYGALYSTGMHASTDQHNLYSTSPPRQFKKHTLDQEAEPFAPPNGKRKIRFPEEKT